MERKPEPDSDVCSVCHRPKTKCHKDCPHYIPPDHKSPVKSKRIPLHNPNISDYLIPFQPIIKSLVEGVIKDYTNIPSSPSVSQSQLSPCKRKWSETEDMGQSSSGFRPGKAEAMIDPAIEAKLSDIVIDRLVRSPLISDETRDGLIQFLKINDPGINRLFQDMKMTDVPESSGSDTVGKSNQEVKISDEDDDITWAYYRYTMDAYNHPLSISISRNMSNVFDDMDLDNFDIDFPVQGSGGGNVDDLAGNKDNGGDSGGGGGCAAE